MTVPFNASSTQLQKEKKTLIMLKKEKIEKFSSSSSCCSHSVSLSSPFHHVNPVQFNGEIKFWKVREAVWPNVDNNNSDWRDRHCAPRGWKQYSPCCTVLLRTLINTERRETEKIFLKKTKVFGPSSEYLQDVRVEALDV